MQWGLPEDVDQKVAALVLGCDSAVWSGTPPPAKKEAADTLLKGPLNYQSAGAAAEMGPRELGGG